jgi:hypothetical protein
MCATRREAGMRENLHSLYRQAMSRWGVASAGCKAEVKELPLKGTGEARCRPPRGQAWLRGRRVSPHEANATYGKFPPCHGISCIPVRGTLTGPRGSDRTRRDTTAPLGYRGCRVSHGSPKDEAGHLLYPASGRDTAERGMGWSVIATYTTSSSPVS